MRALINAAEIENESQDEESNRGIDGRFAQDVTRVGAEGSFRHSASHRSAQATVVLRLLHEDDQHEENRDDDQDKRQNTEENVHEKGSKHQSRRWFVNAP